MKHDVRLRPLLSSGEPQLYARALEDVARDVVLLALTGTDPQAYPALLGYPEEYSPPSPPDPPPDPTPDPDPAPTGEYTGSTKKEAMLKAILGTCRPCCGSGSGGGSMGDIRVPCGCAGCNCCPDVCWWATNWHRSWGTFSPRYATGAVLPPYNMTNYSMTLVSNPDAYYYFGDVGGGEGFCDIGGAVEVGGSCVPGDPIHILTGTVTWTLNVAPFTAYTYTIDYYLDLRILWNCSEALASSTFAGLYVDGMQYGTGADPIFDSFQTQADYFIALNELTSEVVDTSSCGFTLALPGLNIPGLTIIPL